MNGCIFLDRDGTINACAPPHQHVTERAAFQWLPGALEALAFLHKNSERRIAIVTNQSWVGGKAVQGEKPNLLRDWERLDTLHDWMIAQIERAGGQVDEIYVCPHTPDDGCKCRKPKPGLLLRAAEDLGVDLRQSVMVGDSLTDLQAAWAAGIQEVYRVTPTYRLLDAAREIVEKERRQ